VSLPFAEETGIPVHHELHVGLALPPALRSALASRQRPTVDVVWSNAVPALQAVRDAHCTPLDRLRMPVLGQLRGRARPDGPAARFVVYPYVIYYVLGYRVQAFPHGEPRSWNVLLDARHRGKVALYPHGTGLHAIAQAMQGGRLEDIPDAMDACWTFIRRLRPQIAELEYSIGMEKRLRSGVLDLCFRALPNMLTFQEELPVGWSVPEEGTADTTDALWIPRGVPDAVRDAATRYIAFALRPNVQENWCRRLGVMPVHPAAAVPQVLSRPDLPAHADDYRGILHISESLKEIHHEVWARRFADAHGSVSP